ncbi:MAG: MBL fold metallo-hydrolase [Acidobacteriota bacterium]
MPRVPNDGSRLARPAPALELTWVGQSTFVIQDRASVVVTDPHWGPRALLPRRLSAPGLPLAALPADTIAVVSHSHYDHLDRFTVERLPPTVRWFVPLGLGTWLRRHGQLRVTELDWWDEVECDGFRLTCLPAQHWSNRLSQARNATLWCAWMIAGEGGRTFFAGDTGYFPGFAEFARHGPIDAALLPIGAYEPRWFMRYQHLDPAEAYQAFRELAARFFLAMHWGTFDLTDEPPDRAPAELRAAVERAAGADRRVLLPAVGETWRLPGRA